MCLKMFDKYKGWSPLAIRIIAGVIFFMAGLSKLMDSGMTTQMFAGMGIPLAAVAVWVVAILEVLGGLMLFLGLWSRLAAIPLGIIMIVAFIATIPNGFMATWTPLFGLGMMISILFSGSGKLALEDKFKK